jgi:DNA polymerase-4
VQLAPGWRGGGDLDAALEEVSDRFASKAVTRPALIGRDRGWAMPLQPD